MKKAFRILPFLFLLAVLAAALALNTGAVGEGPEKHEIYISDDDWQREEWLQNGYEVYGENGYAEAFAEAKEFAKDYEVNDKGNLIVDGAETELWFYVSGKVLRTGEADAVSSTNFFYGGDDRNGNAIAGSNGKLATLHITSFNTEDEGLYGELRLNSATTSGLYGLFNNCHFKQIRISTNPAGTSSLGQLCLGSSANYLFIDEGVTLAPEKGDGSEGTNSFWAGGNTTNGAMKADVNVTILSGVWQNISMVGGYYGGAKGNCSFTFGGDAECTGVLAGWAADASSDSSKNKNSPVVTGNPFAANITLSIQDNAAVATFYGYCGDKSMYDAANITGNITTTISGSASIGSFYGGSRRGALKGDTLTTITGSPTITSYFGVAGKGSVTGTTTTDLQSCSKISTYTGIAGSGNISGTVTNNISGGTITNFYGSNNNTATAAIETNVTGSPTITTFYGGTKATKNSYTGPITNTFEFSSSGWINLAVCGPYPGCTVSGRITNTVKAGRFGTIRGGGGYSSSAGTGTCTGGIVNYFTGTAENLSVANYCSGGGCGTVSGSVTAEFEGKNYTGALLNFVTGGSITGVKTDDQYYGFNATEANVDGDLVTVITGGTFGDCRGSRSGVTVDGNITLIVTGGTFSGDLVAGIYHANGVLKGSIAASLSDCSFYRYYGSGQGQVDGSIVNTFERVTGTYIYGGAASNAKAKIGGTVTNVISDSTVQTVYAAGQFETIGAPEKLSAVSNTVTNSTFQNFYGGNFRGTSTSTLYGSIENDLTDVVITAGNFCAGNFYGSVTGNITTVIDGAKSSFGSSVYAAGLRLNDAGETSTGKIGGTVGGDVLLTVKAGSFSSSGPIRGKSWIGTSTSGNTTYDCGGQTGARSYKIVFDLTEHDITGVRVSDQTDPLGVDADVEIEIRAGAGTLGVRGSSDCLNVTALTGKPVITVTGNMTNDQAYVALPAGSSETDVEISAERGALLFENRSFIGVRAVRPVGNTVILQPDGAFAMRYLYSVEDAENWEAKTGAAAAFAVSKNGADYEAAALSAVRVGGTEYLGFVVSGIPAYRIADTIFVSNTSMPTVDEYSIAAACRSVIAANEEPAFVAFAKALLDYGKAASAHFGAGEDPTDDYYTDVNDAGYTDPYTDGFSTEGAATQAKIVGTSVLIRDALELKFYVRILGSAEAAALRVRINGTLTPDALTENGAYYTVTHRVPASETAALASVQIEDASGAVVSNIYRDSVASYCAYVAANAAEYEESHVLLCRYLERFIQQSVLYFGGQVEALYSSDPAAALAAIPTANANMTEDQLRQICVDYMTIQQSLIWTPDVDFTYTATNVDKTFTMQAGTLYAGVPYSVAGQDLAGFLEYYDPATRTLRVSGTGAEDGLLFGNHCSTSAYWAWARVSASFRYRGNSRLTAQHGCVPIGGYTGTDIDKFTEDWGTSEVCAANGEQAMYECYAGLLPASGLVTYKSGTTGHVRMAMEAAVVVRDGGVIDGEKSYVLVIEQVSTEGAETVSGEAVTTVGKVGKKYTFKQLFAGSYLPFDVPELCGEAAVANASVSFSFPDGAPLSSILSGSVSSNYGISRAKARITDESGDEVAAFAVQGYGSELVSGKSAGKVTVSQLFTESDLSHLPAGEYTVTFSLRLSNGEIWDGYAFSFTK